MYLSFDLFSDSALALKRLLRLPTFTAGGMELYKGLTLIVDDGCIVKVFYPVYPPDRNAEEVVEWLRGHAGSDQNAT